MTNIPIAKPVIDEPIISQPFIPINEPTFKICNTCQQLFHRKEEDKMTSHYFRCKDCIDKQLSRGIRASCILQ